MAGKRFLGALLMAAGGMVAFLCGMCTLAISVATIVGAMQMKNGSGLGILILPVMLGGLPTAGGVVVFVVGLRLFREGLKRRGQLDKVFD